MPLAVTPHILSAPVLLQPLHKCYLTCTCFTRAASALEFSYSPWDTCGDPFSTWAWADLKCEDVNPNVKTFTRSGWELLEIASRFYLIEKRGLRGSLEAPQSDRARVSCRFWLDSVPLSWVFLPPCSVPPGPSLLFPRFTCQNKLLEHKPFWPLFSGWNPVWDSFALPRCILIY